MIKRIRSPSRKKKREIECNLKKDDEMCQCGYYYNRSCFFCVVLLFIKIYFLLFINKQWQSVKN
jgi:hypothetical protein